MKGVCTNMSAAEVGRSAWQFRTHRVHTWPGDDHFAQRTSISQILSNLVRYVAAQNKLARHRAKKTSKCKNRKHSTGNCFAILVAGFVVGMVPNERKILCATQECLPDDLWSGFDRESRSLIFVQKNDGLLKSTHQKCELFPKKKMPRGFSQEKPIINFYFSSQYSSQYITFPLARRLRRSFIYL